MEVQTLDLFTYSESFANFILLNNQMVVASLQNFTNQYTHISGAKQSGKTHLLKAWANSVANSGIFMDSSKVTNLCKLPETYKYIAIDNIELLTQEQQIELFNLFNMVKLNNLDNLILTSSSTSLETEKNLREDLKTRILSGVTFNLKALNDDDLLKAIRHFIEKEGIMLGKNEQYYLINHYTRNIGILIQTILQLAKVAVQEKRNITIPFIKEVIK